MGSIAKGTEIYVFAAAAVRPDNACAGADVIVTSLTRSVSLLRQ